MYIEGCIYTEVLSLVEEEEEEEEEEEKEAVSETRHHMDPGKVSITVIRTRRLLL